MRYVQPRVLGVRKITTWHFSAYRSKIKWNQCECCAIFMWFLAQYHVVVSKQIPALAMWSNWVTNFPNCNKTSPDSCSSFSVTVLLVCPGWPPDVSVCWAHGLLCLCCAMCFLLSIVCPLPSSYLIIVSVAPPVSPSLPSFVSLYLASWRL